MTRGKMKRKPCHFAETGKSKYTEMHKRRLEVDTPRHREGDLVGV